VIEGGKECVASGDGADGIGELLGRDVLEHEATRSCGHRFVDVLVQLERREDQNADSGKLARDAACRLDFVSFRHSDIHEDHVRGELSREFNGLRAVAGFSDDGDVGLRFENCAEASSDKGFVVGEDNRDHGAASGSRARTD
jgi:hypothetical protein